MPADGGGETLKTRLFLLSVSFAIASNAATRAEEGALIASMDDLRFGQPREKGRADLVEGKVGKAIRFRFDKEARSTFFTSNIHGTPEWDRAAGFSFWVKGEGLDGFGGLQFIFDDDFAVRYDLAFPVKGTAWTKVSVAWDDLIPVLPGPRARPLRASGGNPPSKLSGLWFGKWWYWGDYPALAFDVDEIRLEPSIDRPPAADRPDGPPTDRVLARLRAGRPLTIVTMGDSLTDKRHWANREVCWVDLLRDRLKAKYGTEASIINPAIGGTQLRQNLVLMPVWLDGAPGPDVVTVFFGGNDWDAGMRGEEFERACADAVDRIRRATRGKADVLILTTNPAASRWDAAKELAEACRRAARGRNAGLADTDKAFREADGGDRDRLFVHDRVHLSRAGHEVVAGSVLEAIESGER
jgi:lysophospholipase L1-like esterase